MRLVACFVNALAACIGTEKHGDGLPVKNAVVAVHVDFAQNTKPECSCRSAPQARVG